MGEPAGRAQGASPLSTDAALLVLRLTLGIVFAAHGAQKVLGAFGGPGLAGTVQGMAMAGIPAPLAYLAAFTEFFGGLAVLIGLLARLASAGLAVTMLVAIFKVHLSGGFFAPKGFEYPFVLLGIALALIAAGPGRFAIADIEGRMAARRRA